MPFYAILEILAENNLLSSAYWIMEKAVQVNLHGIVDVLIDGHVKSEVSIKLLDLLLWIYTKGSMTEQCVSTFDKMVKNGLYPNVENCNRISGVLRNKDLVPKAREIYKGMSKYGICPTIVTYNTLLDSFCKKGEVQEALDLLSEMRERGCNPSSVLLLFSSFLYYVLLSILQAIKARERIFKVAPSIEIHTNK